MKAIYLNYKQALLIEMGLQMAINEYEDKSLIQEFEFLKESMAAIKEENYEEMLRSEEENILIEEIVTVPEYEEVDNYLWELRTWYLESELKALKMKAEYEAEQLENETINKLRELN